MKNDNPSESEELTRAQAEASAQNAVTGVIRSNVTDLQIQSVARAQARFSSYKKIYENFIKYIDKQSEQLANGLFADSPYKELGVARLISIWLAESEQFFKEVEPLLQGAEKTLRKGYLEQSFEHLPPVTKETLLKEFNAKKQELLIWFVQRVQEELKETNGEVIDV
jgi:hypothetical protein